MREPSESVCQRRYLILCDKLHTVRTDRFVSYQMGVTFCHDQTPILHLTHFAVLLLHIPLYGLTG